MQFLGRWLLYVAWLDTWTFSDSFIHFKVHFRVRLDKSSWSERLLANRLRFNLILWPKFVSQSILRFSLWLCLPSSNLIDLCRIWSRNLLSLPWLWWRSSLKSLLRISTRNLFFALIQSLLSRNWINLLSLRIWARFWYRRGWSSMWHRFPLSTLRSLWVDFLSHIWISFRLLQRSCHKTRCTGWRCNLTFFLHFLIRLDQFV